MLMRPALVPVLFNKRRYRDSPKYLGTLLWVSGATISGIIDIGPNDPETEIFLVCGGQGNQTVTAASSTVAGKPVAKTGTEFDGLLTTIACCLVSVPGVGGFVPILVTFSGAMTGGSVSVYRVDKRPNRGSLETDGEAISAASGTTSTLTAVTIPANGFWLGGHLHTSTAATTSPATEDSDVTSGGTQFVSCSRGVVQVAATPSDQWSWTGSESNASVAWAFN